MYEIYDSLSLVECPKYLRLEEAVHQKPSGYRTPKEFTTADAGRRGNPQGIAPAKETLRSPIRIEMLVIEMMRVRRTDKYTGAHIGGVYTHWHTQKMNKHKVYTRTYMHPRCNAKRVKKKPEEGVQ